MSKKRNLRFRTLAEKRMSRVLLSLKSIENLANKQNYFYSSTDIDELFRTLRDIGKVTHLSFEN